jgi:hypothetical protein
MVKFVEKAVAKSVKLRKFENRENDDVGLLTVGIEVF